MKKSRFFLMFLTVILLALPIVFLSSCATADVESRTVSLPEKYTELPVEFIDRPDLGGSLITYPELRKLIFNIQNMRDYEARLEAVILGDYPLSPEED
ncbi:MAG: hypothetical protein J5800_05425 [Spirochaetales bacterium]|nr:hypothetical protein [Spirochaetales bacterium]MBR4426846.1 hypothetical protein [Spirochaetales bacterium]